MQVLVTFIHDWCDEFTAYGLLLLPSESAAAKYERLLGECADRPFSFGTNEGWESLSEVLEGFLFQAISEGCAITLQTLMPGIDECGFGQIPSLKDLEDMKGEGD